MMYLVAAEASPGLGYLQASVLGQVVGNGAPTNPGLDPV